MFKPYLPAPISFGAFASHDALGDPMAKAKVFAKKFDRQNKQGHKIVANKDHKFGNTRTGAKRGPCRVASR
jgi:hypothetical protein